MSAGLTDFTWLGKFHAGAFNLFNSQMTDRFSFFSNFQLVGELENIPCCMKREVFFVGFTEDEAKDFIEAIVNACLKRYDRKLTGDEQHLTIRQACKFMGVSAPTLRMFVAKGYIRRHDLGARKKYFCLSELKEDIKSLPNSIKQSG
jgi:excisionase family DNA binding protein